MPYGVGFLSDVVPPGSTTSTIRRINHEVTAYALGVLLTFRFLSYAKPFIRLFLAESIYSFKLQKTSESLMCCLRAEKNFDLAHHLLLQAVGF